MLASFLSTTLLAVLSAWIVTAIPISSDDFLRIKTSSGTVLGIVNGTTPNVRQFLSIPYAQPPLGNLRFAPPAVINDSSKIIDATQYGPACPQVVSAPSGIQSVVTQLAFTGATAEDCLTLAIWAPINGTGEKLPVFLWLFGGGYTGGGIDTLYQIPSQWVERSQAHIVISINTRTNIFGYPGSAGLEYQNPGLLDQRFAIEWAQQNIASFGGDPERMVVWGQSSGGGSVDLLNFAYPDDPIVVGFISDSGSVFLNNQKDDPTFSNFSYVAAHFNCSNSSPAAELACLRNPAITSDDIENFLKENSANSSAPSVHFIPFVDNVSIFPNYSDRYAMGALSDRPAIFGTNEREGFQVAPFPTDPYTTSANATLANEITYQAFTCPAYYSATQRSQLNLTTFRYQYRGNFTNISPIWWFGAYHATELPMLFGTYPDFRGPPSAFETAVSEEMQDLWLAFAKDPEQGVTTLGGWTNITEGNVEVFAEGNNTVGNVLTLVPATEIDSVCSPEIMAEVIGGANVFASL